MTCSTCGLPLAPGTPSCPRCGTAVAGPVGWAAPPAYGTPGYGAPTRPPPKGPTTNRYAAASMWCALSFCLFPAAIVLGIVALVQLADPANDEGGRGMAIGGLAVGTAVLLLLVVSAAS